jgi:hypothetical protein
MTNSYEPHTNGDRQAELLIHRIKTRLNNPKWKRLSSEDQLIIAQNLWDILEDPVLRRIGVSKTQILQESGQGNEGDSTKRLYYFAIPSNLERVELERRGANLRKNVRNYVKIAAVAAEHAKWPADKYLLQLFRGTRYMDSSGEEAEAGFITLATMLQELGRHVVRTTPSLIKYFEKMRHGIFGFAQLYDCAPNIDGYRPELHGIGDRQFAYCGDCWGLPSIPLYDLPFSDPLPARLKIDQEALVPRSEGAADAPLKFVNPAIGPGWSHPVLVLLDTEVAGDDWRSVEIYSRVSVWLTLAPLGPDGTPVAAFQARVLLQIYDGDTLVPLVLPHWSEDPRVIIRAPDGLRRGWLVPDRELPVMVGDNPLKAGGYASTLIAGFTGNYFYHERVDSLSCKKFLDVIPDHTWSLQNWTAHNNLLNDCPPGTVGSFLLGNLAKPTGFRLDHLLQGAAENLVDAATEILDAARAETDFALDRLMDEWTSTEPE